MSDFSKPANCIDSFSYASHPEGEQILFGFLGLGALIYMWVIWSRMTATAVAVYITVAALILGGRCFFMLRERSDVTLDDDGIRRGRDDRPWIKIPWSAIDKVVVRKFRASNAVASQNVFRIIPKAGGAVRGFSRAVSIIGNMSRSDAFGALFLSCLHDHGIKVEGE